MLSDRVEPPTTMPSLTRTTHLSTFTTPPPGAASHSFDTPSKTHLTVPVGSAWTPGRHWHNNHTEHFKVLSGAILVTINNNSFVVTGASPTLTIPRKARHELMRWDCPGRKGHQNVAQEAFRKEMLAKGQSKELEKLRAQQVEAEEWTTPTDGEKEVFFRNLLSVISEPRKGILGEMLRFIHIVIIYQDLDTRMVILDMGSEDGNGWRGMVEEMMWWVVLGVAGLIGGVLGLKPVSEAYTPDRLISQWEEKNPK